MNQDVHPLEPSEFLDDLKRQCTEVVWIKEGEVKSELVQLGKYTVNSAFGWTDLGMHWRT